MAVFSSMVLDDTSMVSIYAISVGTVTPETPVLSSSFQFNIQHWFLMPSDVNV
jgi:hypothetical protein